jgi:hypothetical protein
MRTALPKGWLVWKYCTFSPQLLLKSFQKSMYPTCLKQSMEPGYNDIGYNVRHSVVPPNTSLLTIILNYSAITTQNPFHEVITEFDSISFLHFRQLSNGNWIFLFCCKIGLHSSLFNTKFGVSLWLGLRKRVAWRVGLRRCWLTPLYLTHCSP